MEQNQTSRTERAKHISSVQILALIFGIIGCAAAFVSAVFSLWTFFVNVSRLSSGIPSLAAGTILNAVALLCSLAAIVLGIVGLMLDRKTRQHAAGLVLSVIGIRLGAAGLVFELCILFWSFWLQIISNIFQL